ncbi:MAG: DUF4827 domain-containing protein [Bacteroides sp.]|nr:DUF4827 domain-containing protein [Bacteroides sp.]
MNKLISPIVLLLALAFGLTSCEDTKSYAELLSDENQAVNKFLVQHKVIDHLPTDGKFEVGEDAPYYRIDDESNVYMQVLSLGTDEKPSKNDRVYFRFLRYNMFHYVIGGDNTYLGEGNSDGMNSVATYFLFDNFTVSDSSQYGEGIQLPMKYLGYNAKVNLVVKSQAGFSDDLSYVIPYLFTITYYKSMI